MALTKTITPEQYIQAEIQVKAMLEERGYIVQDWGYEHRFTDSAKTVIGQINKPTSLYVRTTPDKVVIGSKESLLIEIKDASEPNIALEAFPILVQRQLFWSFGITTLYLFVSGTNISGEYVQNLPVDRVILPNKLSAFGDKFWTPLLNNGFPNNKLERMSTGGSGDPFVIILNKTRNQFRDIQYLL